jgi:hypothetical protein
MRALGLTLLATPTFGETLNYGVGLGVGRSDNVLRTANNTESAYFGIAGLEVDLEQKTRSLTTLVKGDVQYVKYYTDSYGSELVGRLDGTMQLSIVPERIEWLIQDNFGVSEIDQFGGDALSNLQNVNYFTTGPRLSARVGQQVYLQLDGRYSMVDFENSALDSNRIEGEFAVGFDLSAASRLSLVATSEDIRFGDSVATEGNTRRSGQLRYSLKGARTVFGLGTGAIWSSQGTDHVSAPLFRVDISRKVSSALKISLTASSTLTDGGNSFREQTLDSVGRSRTSPAITSAETFEQRFLRMGWTLERSRSLATGFASYTRDAYESSPLLNVKRLELYGSVSRRLSPVMTLKLSASAIRSDFLNDSFADWNSVYGAALNIRVSRSWHLGAEFNYFVRDVTNRALVRADNYNESRGTLSISYRSR